MVDVHPAVKIDLTSPNKCKGCNEPIKKFSSWCKSCVSSYFSKNFKNWSSGNQNLDEFIRDIQLKEQRFNLAIEWIPFDRLTDLTLIKRGGYGTVYKATWLDGYINEWDLEKEGWKRAGKKTVCLKQIHNSSDNITKDFLEAIQHQVRARSTRVISVYGFTQDTSTKDYMIVMQYSSEGSLRESLDKNFNSLSWYDKLNILKDSANGLKDIHKLGLHRNLHPGNIIMIDKSTPNFSDFGMCKPIGHYKSASDQVYGVLPYVAPEVLAGRKYTQDADVYSFSIIMYEVLTGLPPYYNVPHDSSLAMEIHKGLRPECNPEGMPPVILDYIKRCWDPRTSNRPTAQDVFYNISQWLEKYKDKESTLYKQIKNIEDLKDYSSADAEKRSGPLRYEINPSAVYHSRSLDFAGPKNSEKDISGKARCCNTGVLSKITSFFFSS